MGCVAAVLAALIVAPAAWASKGPGTTHPLFVGKGKQRRLAMPMPTVTQVPTLKRLADGRIKVVAKARYVAHHWKRQRGVARDRAMVTLHVARRVLSTGPDPSAPRFTKTSEHVLKGKRTGRTYSVTLPKKASSFLKSKGGFASKAKRRAAARKLVWVDVQQDRDFQAVDGRHDWRQGTAWNAGDRLQRQPALTGSAGAQAADATHPSGTITVQNATSWGVYTTPQGGASYYDGSTGYPNVPMATVNNTGTPLAVAGSAVQCLDSGDSGSNPTGFGNFDSDNNPQPYAPGATTGGVNAQSDSIPQSTGFAVTENITSDDSLAMASNNQVADVSGYIDGVLNLAFVDLSLFLPVPSGFGGGSGLGFLVTNLLDVDTIPSPGTIVGAVLDIVLAIQANSCSAYPNLMALAATEAGGGAVAENMQVEESGFEPYYDPTGPGQPYGEQVNPSINGYGVSPLYLHGFFTGTAVVPNNVAGTGAAYVGITWLNQNPCNSPSEYYYGASCTSTPAASPEVTNPSGSGSGPVDCGTGNTDCPAPAAGFPTGTTVPATVFTNPPTKTTISGTSTSANGCGTLVPSSDTQHMGGTFVFSPNGQYVLSMTSSGVLELYTSAGQMLWTAPASPITSNSTVKFDGSLSIIGPNGSALWTAGASGANYLAVQNDGNVVIYNTNNQSAPWSTGTAQGTACNAFSVPVTLSGYAAAQAEGCAWLSAVPKTSNVMVFNEQGGTILSPNGQAKLTIYPSGSQGGELQMQNVGDSYTGLWWTETNGVDKNEIQQLVMQTDGNLVGFNIYDDALWASGTNGNPGAFLAVQNDGNLVIYNEAFTEALWASAGSNIDGSTGPKPGEVGILLPNGGCGLRPGTYTPSNQQ